MVLLVVVVTALLVVSMVAHAVVVVQDQQEEQECFEQQYTNRVANFGALHLVKRVGVISPLGAFHLAHFISPDDEEEDDNDAQQQWHSNSNNANNGGGGGRQSAAVSMDVVERHLARHANGEKLVIYSGHSAATLEWVQLDLLAVQLRLEPILGDSPLAPANDAAGAVVSPVLLVTACPTKARPVAFTGHSFSVRPDQLGIVPAYENELLINFRTFENGLFFYSMADHGDHLIVQLSGGRVQVFFDFGAHQRSELSGGLALNDGNWHELRWTHRFDSAELHVDGVWVNSTDIVGLYRKLDLHVEVEIGGRPEELGDEQVVEFSTASLQHGFHGCLARLELNGVNLLDSAPVELRPCQIPRPQLIAIGPSTALQIPYSFLPFALDFHVVPIQSNSIINSGGPLLAILDHANGTLLQLRLMDGGQMLSVGTGLAGEMPKTVEFADGQSTAGWHSLAIKLRGESLELELDGTAVYWVQGHQARRIGTAMQTFLLSAQGCYRSTTIDLNQGLPTGPDFYRDKCPLFERCSPNPCQNGGKCLQTGFNAHQCECPRNYTGRYCQISKLPHSCEQHFFSAKLRGKQPYGKAANEQRVLLDLDGGGPLKPFAVACRRIGAGKGKQQQRGKKGGNIFGIGTEEMRQQQNKKEQQQLAAAADATIVLTVLAHDGPPDGLVVRGVTEPGAIRRVLDYGLGAEELERFMGAFEQCEQRMRFECAGGQRLMTYGGENRPSTWYGTRNAQHGLQWADAPPFSRMCSCALNNTCIEQNRQCNCDSGRAAVDEGVSAHQQLLPILQLFVGGGTEHQSMANVTIGPLQCTGRYVFDAITFTDRNQRLLTALNFPSAATFHASITLRFAHSQLTVFTFTSANHERWYQLFVRAGRLVGQLVYAGISHELVSDVRVDDNRWHVINWEVDEQSMRLQIDRAEKTVFAASVPPRASTLIIGSRTGKDRSGFAGQMRNFLLNGEEIKLGQLAQRALGRGIQMGEWGACDEGKTACRNGGECVELYDGFRCNCTRTPFNGDTCEDEVGMWVPLGSELKIAWQHPAQVSNCFRINIQSATHNVNLIQAKALFAEAQFNLNVDANGHLNVHIFDGYLFTQNVTYDGLYIADNKSKDIHFCANMTEFYLTINGEKALSVEGNFTFFAALNVWHFVDHHFAGCISRLMIGDAMPLKNPRESRLIHTGKIRFGSCPFDNLEHKKPRGRLLPENDGFGGAGAGGGSMFGPNGVMMPAHDEIHASSQYVKSQRQLLFITPAIGLFSAGCILFSLCAFLLYVQRKPDGVYKTHEKNGGGIGINNYGVPPLLLFENGEQQFGNGGTGSLSRPLRVPPQASASVAPAKYPNNNNNNNNLAPASGMPNAQHHHHQQQQQPSQPKHHSSSSKKKAAAAAAENPLLDAMETASKEREYFC